MTSNSRVEKLREAAIVFDTHKNCLFLNQAAEQIFGNCEASGPHRSQISLLGDWIREQVKTGLPQPLVFKLQELPVELQLNEFSLEIAVILQEQLASDEFYQELNQHTSLAIREPKAKPNHVSSDQKSLQRYTIQTLEYDRLTGLPNHQLLLQHIKQEINFCETRTDYNFAVLFIDINRFKIINSSLGRIIGDRLLISVAQRLKKCLRSQDFIARMGNDEFVILLSNVEHLQYATNIAERIYHELAVTFDLGGYEVFIEASIGIAVGSQAYHQPDNLLRDAELALSNAKRQNKFPYQIFDQSMRG
ncbi:MAG: GGDEF domain-containing protein, partial [Cyanobacteria bacterium J06600_6]